MVGLSLDTANTGQTGLGKPLNTNITTYIAPHQTQLTAEGAAVGPKNNVFLTLETIRVDWWRFDCLFRVPR